MTDYIRNDVLEKRPYIRLECCIEALRNPLRREIQPEDGRIPYFLKKSSNCRALAGSALVTTCGRLSRMGRLPQYLLSPTIQAQPGERCGLECRCMNQGVHT